LKHYQIKNNECETKDSNIDDGLPLQLFNQWSDGDGLETFKENEDQNFISGSYILI